MREPTKEEMIEGIARGTFHALTDTIQHGYPVLIHGEVVEGIARGVTKYFQQQEFAELLVRSITSKEQNGT